MNTQASGPAATVIVKLGGSTLGEHDTALADIVALSRAGRRVIVVHGGGAEISRWLEIHQLESHFVDGLRVTDAAAVRVVVAVLAGAVNKELVAQLSALGLPAIGLCGADGGLLEAEVENPALGLVGAVRRVNGHVLQALTDAGFVPLVAPIAIDHSARLLNVNADTVAGEVAAAFPGSTLVFLTDVPGVMAADGALLSRIDEASIPELRRDGTLRGGMIPKVDACLTAARAGCVAMITDGRRTGALRAAVTGELAGTTVG
jgi:acetylglutamate kinase